LLQFVDFVGVVVDEKERMIGNDPEQELRDTGFHDYQRLYVNEHN